MISRIAGIVCFVFISNFFAYTQQSVWEIADKREIVLAYQKACVWFINTPSYYFKLRYTSYKDHISKEQIESSEGYYKRIENKYVTEAAGIRTLQNADFKLIIDTTDKIVTVMNPGNLSPAMTNTEELETLLNDTKNVRKIRQAKSIRYRIDFNKNDLYEAYEFIINDKGLLAQLTYYYNEQVEKVETDGRFEKQEEIKVTPRLEIVFFDYQVPVKYTASDFSERFVHLVEKKKITLTGAYKQFRLMDYRLQAKK